MKAVAKKLSLASVVCVTAFAAQANSNGANDVAVGIALDQQLSVVFELENQYRFILGNQGAAFDYIFETGQFNTSQPIGWYVGVGAWGEWDDGFGARVPLGINYQVSDGWQLYGQVQPELDLHSGWELGLGAALGAKYRF